MFTQRTPLEIFQILVNMTKKSPEGFYDNYTISNEELSTAKTYDVYKSVTKGQFVNDDNTTIREHYHVLMCRYLNANNKSPYNLGYDQYNMSARVQKDILNKLTAPSYGELIWFNYGKPQG